MFIPRDGVGTSGKNPTLYIWVMERDKDQLLSK